ncbi:hypothetical protein UFOVP849_32 [uncultured Caudovirales phage]|uniref:Uncharacterized protein n=1 Tax=uncultured Caudovirales phage TaxID=2100421 RepID=A0A6J5P5R1_9CAUD|nr:hypothetical protein UFOVP849_32 [uncultured Caudovirales phage]
MSFQIPNGDTLVTYVQDFTGSNNAEEIKKCILMAEMAMRNIELPALRTDPYTTLGTADENGNVPIPSDMNKPIQFFNQGNNGQTSTTGPWIIYDRIGDRDMLGAQLVAPYYLNPTNVPAVIRGKFAEIGNKYSFLPLLGEGSIVNMYYYKSWPLLFAPTTQVISATGTVGNIAGSGQAWTATITNMLSTVGLTAGDELTATAGTGSFGTGTVTVVTIPSSTSITVAVAGPTPTAGTVTNITQLGTVQSNAVLQSWPEGYVYGTLHEYYVKRHNSEDAAIYKAKFDEAWKTVNNQNNLSKWNGGHTRMTSIFQPRTWRQYSVK